MEFELPTRYECSAARERVNQPFFLECFNGFANCGSADAELLGEFAFGGELATLGEFALEDSLLNLLYDLFVQTGSLNNFLYREASLVLPMTFGRARINKVNSAQVVWIETTIPSVLIWTQ